MMDLLGLSKFACTLGSKGETKWKKAPSPSSFNKKDPRNEARTNQRPNESPFTGPDRPALDPSAVYAVLPPTPHSPITSNSPPPAAKATTLLLTFLSVQPQSALCSRLIVAE